MAEATLRNATDTYVAQDKSSTNYATSTKLGVSTGGSATAYAYLYFNRPQPLDSTVLSAKLRLYRQGTWTGSRTLTVRRLKEQLKATRATWSAKPDVVTTGTPVPLIDNGGADGSYVEIDVTGPMQTVANGGDWWGFRVESNEATRRYFSSANGLSGRRPELYVQWGIPPSKPKGLHPSGSRAIAGPNPVLRWAASPGTSDQTITAVHVQASPTANWATAWDSGWVDSTDAELDTRPLPTWPPLANNASTQWRVQVRDGAGLVSDWSDPATFFRKNLAPVTILNPAGATVTDPTPPILWSTTGQKSYRVLLVDAAKPSVTLADSGQRTGTETAWTPPAKTLAGVGPYRVEVRVWDAEDRDPSVIDPGYATSSRDFTVNAGTTVAPVVGLDVAQDLPYPTVLLTWTRADAADKYVISRDGNVLDEVEPLEVLTSGTSYLYEDETPKVWHPHTWSVQAVVNGDSSPKRSVTMTPAQRGIWLLDKKRGLRVWIAGKDAGTWAQLEDATVFVPLNGKQPVRRVQAQQRYSGSLNGQLLDGYGRSVWDYEDDLQAMRDEPDRPVVLAAADLTLRVLIGNVVTAPTTSVPPQRIVSFDFWEVA